ncbi:MAG: transcriptional regulator [Microbacterium sp.]|nr:transcriptional regulator [Microbacterium sp.]
MASLGAGVELDFATLAEILEVGDSALSKAIAYLDSTGYLRARKGTVGNRSRTWVRSTAAGRAAFAAHLSALREIVEIGGTGAL